jgi:hypothetical protein
MRPASDPQRDSNRLASVLLGLGTEAARLSLGIAGDSGGTIRRRAPSGRCKSTSIPEVGSGQAEAVGTLTQPKAADRGSAPGSACLATQRFFRACLRSRKCCAT